MKPTVSSKMPQEQDPLLIEWLAVIGFVIMFWAPIERSIDQCVYTTYRHQKNKSANPKRPIHLSQKLVFLEKHSIESPILRGCFKLIEPTKHIAKLRDIFVHGVIETWTQTEITISKIRKPDFDGEYIREKFSISLLDLNSATSTATVLSDCWHGIYCQLREEVRPVT